MEQIANEIRLGYSDREINALLESIGDASNPITRHFSQDEEFFLKLQGDLVVPHFPIHHDVRVAQPDKVYLGNLINVIAQVVRLAPQALNDLAYFFDPAEILRPSFFKIYRLEECFYLYLLRLDLMLKPSEGVVIERGTNDMTSLYRSRKLFLEAVVIPLDEVIRVEGKVKSFRIKQTISQTWIGEQGRGYFVQGIWIDMDLTKFFSKLFLPKGKKTYPFYPYLCKYKTVCQSVIDLGPEERKGVIPQLHRAVRFLLPTIDTVQAVMKNTSFSEEMKFFLDLKAKVPEAWYAPWERLRVEAYLNEAEQREFSVQD